LFSLIRVIQNYKYKNKRVNRNLKHGKEPSLARVFVLMVALAGIALFLSSCSIINPSTGSVEGYVYENTVLEPIPVDGALVSITGSTNTATTEQNGYFFIEEVSIGIRDLTITKENYKTHKFLKIMIEENQTTLVNDGNPIIINAVDEKYLFDSAVLYYEQESYLDALNLFQQLLAEYPESSYRENSQYYIAWCYLSMDDYTKAIDEFENLIINYPESELRDDAQYYIGWTYEIRMSLHIQATLAYYTVLFDYPNSRWADDAQLGIGNCYFATGDYGNAIKEYQKVLDNYSESDLSPLAQYSLAQSYRRAGYRSTAIEKYQELIFLYPESEYCGPSQYYIGYCYYEKDKYQSAIDEFQKVIDEYSYSTWPGEDRQIAPGAQFYIGWCYEKLELWAEALTAYQLLIDNYPGSTWSDGSSIPAYTQERIDWINDNYPPEE